MAWKWGVTEACKIQEFVQASEPGRTSIPKTQLAGAGRAARWPGLQGALSFPGLF